MIQASISALIELQKIDRTLLQLKKEAQGIPGRKEKLEARSAAERKEKEDADAGLNANLNAIKQLELDVEAIRNQMNRYKTQQMDVKTNEEYKAITHEIAECEQKINGVEDQELELMEAQEPLRDRVKAAEAALEVSKTEISKLQSDLDQRLAVVKEQFAEQKAKRGPLAGSLEDGIESIYMGLLQTKDGLAIVPLEDENCGGCHMKLTPQILHDAHAGTKWVHCGHCGRILFDSKVVC